MWWDFFRCCRCCRSGRVEPEAQGQQELYLEDVGSEEPETSHTITINIEVTYNSFYTSITAGQITSAINFAHQLATINPQNAEGTPQAAIEEVSEFLSCYRSCYSTLNQTGICDNEINDSILHQAISARYQARSWEEIGHINAHTL